MGRFILSFLFSWKIGDCWWNNVKRSMVNVLCRLLNKLICSVECA